MQQARGRVQMLEKKISDSRTEQEARSREQAALAVAMAERETRLNASEKETFGGFLKKDFFTKSDFSSLESFYSKTWDRLSDRGKDEMSHRVWEGIRRGEYTFSELPKTVREKETEWAYTTLVNRQRSVSGMDAIPAGDREDFIRAYESGKKEEAQKVLERDSFKQNMFRSSESKSIKQASVELGRNAEGNDVGKLVSTKKTNENEQTEAKSGGKSEAELSAFTFNGVKLADVQQQGSSSDIPNAKIRSSNETSLGG